MILGWHKESKLKKIIILLRMHEKLSRENKNNPHCAMWCIYLDSILRQPWWWTLFEVWGEILVHMLKHQIKWHLSFSALAMANVQKSNRKNNSFNHPIVFQDIISNSTGINEITPCIRVCQCAESVQRREIPSSVFKLFWAQCTKKYI